jgi:hypothetical protein
MMQAMAGDAPGAQEVLERLEESGVRRVYEALGERNFVPGASDTWIVASPLRADKLPTCIVRRADGAWRDRESRESGTIFDAVMRARGLSLPEAVAEVARLAGTAPAPAARRVEAVYPSRRSVLASIVATYPYRDAGGELLFEVVRLAPKSFRYRRPARDDEETEDGWVWALGSTQKVLYRLPELLAATAESFVYLCEGEKDVDRLAGLGLVATCNPSGAAGWRAAYADWLSGRDVVLLPDNDAAGAGWVRSVSASLQPVARSLRVVALPGLAPAGDVSDWLDAGGTVAELDGLAFAARSVVRQGPGAVGSGSRTPSMTPEPAAPAGPKFHLVVTEMADVQPTPVQWLWQRWLPRGKVTILGGHPGHGKSTLAAAFAAILSTGGRWPDGTPSPRGRTLFLLAEDAVNDTVRPRLDQLGADVTQVATVDAVAEDGSGAEQAFSLGAHLPLLEELLAERTYDLIVVDPLSAFLTNRNRNDEGEIRDLLTPLGKLAERRGVTVLGIMHVGKPSGARRTALQSLLGATAFGAFARSVLMVAPCGAGRDRQQALAVVKSNLALHPPALAWSRPDDGPLVWHGELAEDFDALLTGTSRGNEPRDDAEAFLRELLADGPVPSKVLEAEARAAGIAERTLYRARKASGVRSERLWRNGDSEWYAMLPGADWEGFVEGSARIDHVATPPLRLVPDEQRSCVDCGKPCGGALRCSACAAATVAASMACHACGTTLFTAKSIRRGLCTGCSDSASEE